MAATRRPHFTITDDEDEEEQDSDQTHSTRDRRVPAIVIEDPAGRPARREDLGEEERHVGFADRQDATSRAGREGRTGGGRDGREMQEKVETGKSTFAFPAKDEKHTEDRGDEAEYTDSGRGKGIAKEGHEVTYPPSSPRDGGKGFDADRFKEEDQDTPKTLKDRLPPLPSWMEWIPPHLNWKGLRPVIRASVAAWCGLLLMLCGPSQRMLGQASFLVLVVATICPASLPIASMLEQSFFQFLLVSCSWAWGSMALAIAHAARHRYKWTQAEFATNAAARLASPGMTAAEVSAAVRLSIFHGDYLEASSSVVCGVFLGAGAGFLLWLRGYLGPGPALFGVIFAMILQVIMLTTGVLFPYPYYSIGLIFFIPFCCQQAINIACTFLILPETLAHQFSDRLIATLQPMQKVIQDQKDMLKANPRTEDWLKFKSLRTGTNAAIGGIALLGLSETNLTREISYARVSGRDLATILQKMRILTQRTTGFPQFYEVIEKHLHREESDAKGGPVADDLIVHLGRSRANSVTHSPSSSRGASPTRERHEPDGSATVADPDALNKALARVQHLSEPRGHHSSSNSVTFSPSPFASSPLSPTPQPGSVSRRPSDSLLRRNRLSSGSLADLEEHSTRDSEGHPSGNGHHHHSSSPSHRRSRRRSRSRNRHGKSSSSHISIPSLLHDVLHPVLDIKPVGVIESTAYMDLEDYLHNARDEEHLEHIVQLLSSSSDELINTLDSSVGHLISTIRRFKSAGSTWASIFRYDDKAVEDIISKSRAQLSELKSAHEAYRDAKRLEVIKPFSKLFDPYGAEARGEYDGEDEEAAGPSHRGLFWAFAYQHSLLSWSEALIDLFETMVKIEEKRRRPRFWFPDWRKARFARTGAQEQDYGEEDPDALRDLNMQAFSAPRNPDYTPPQTLFQVLGIKLHQVADRLTRRDALFGLKAGILIGLCSMPAYFPSTAFFFYRERGIWVLVMICLTTNQYIGDVLFGFLVRVFGTIAGAAIGLLVWSIAAQTGRGNPFALAATTAVAYPLIFFWRVHFMPPMTAILPAVTAQLVIGYSWQDAHYPALSTVGYGWDVAWRRFVCVMIGISIAFVGAFLPPATRQKVTIRRTYAKVISRMGGLIAQILSFANTKKGPVKPPKVIINNLTALRQRVNRTVQAKAMARFELSLQGEWPSDLYASLQSLQMEMLDQLGQLAGVISKLDEKWTKALLHRTQLSNPRFLQELLATVQLISSAFDYATPLPYVYNPLLERFLKSPEAIATGHNYGYDVTLDQEIEGIPLHVNLETICSLEYLRFSSGVSQCYAVINRLDRLMFVAKSLVGEQFLVYGLDTHSGSHFSSGRTRYRRLPNEDLDEHLHGSLSRRTSFERSDSIA
ncbi:hypothetical protein JCM11641_001599 [Rhodosporidiobolus odoratus]